MRVLSFRRNASYESRGSDSVPYQDAGADVGGDDEVEIPFEYHEKVVEESAKWDTRPVIAASDDESVEMSSVATEDSDFSKSATASGGGCCKGRKCIILIALLLVVLIALAVALGVALPKRNSSSSQGTSQPPPPPPSGCYSSLDDLDAAERTVTNLDEVRTYILCPKTTFLTGIISDTGVLIGGETPLMLRKNMHVKCGESGSSANDCVITRGDFALISFPANYDTATVNTNVMVQGVTFDNVGTAAVSISLAGEFTFVDCIFRNNDSGDAPVLVEWAGGSIDSVTGRSDTGSHRMMQSGDRRKLQVETTVDMEFSDCVFEDNTCASGSRLGLVLLGGDGVNSKFTNCLFRNNNFAVEGVNDNQSYGVIIENFGSGRLEIESSCFINNQAYGNALVASYGDDIGSFSGVYGSGNTVTWVTDLQCEFAALVDPSTGDYPNVACADFDSSFCAVEGATLPDIEKASSP